MKAAFLWLPLACSILPAARAPAAGPDLAASMDNWLVEKWEDDPIQVRVEGGALRASTHSPENGVMLWLKRDLPADFVLEYDFTPLSQTGFFLVFFCARGTDGHDVLSPEAQADRTARTLFKKYTDGKVRCYHVSYRRGEEANCNLRKNPGLVLLKQQPLAELLPRGKTAHVRLTKRGARILLEVNGKQFMDYTDRDAAIAGGRLALRQVYDSEASYKNITLTELRQ